MVSDLLRDNAPQLGLFLGVLNYQSSGLLLVDDEGER